MFGGSARRVTNVSRKGELVRNAGTSASALVKSAISDNQPRLLIAADHCHVAKAIYARRRPIVDVLGTV
jgi:hypothetical protein